jgi:hypothetical protein
LPQGEEDTGLVRIHSSRGEEEVCVRYEEVVSALAERREKLEARWAEAEREGGAD